MYSRSSQDLDGDIWGGHVGGPGRLPGGGRNVRGTG